MRLGLLQRLWTTTAAASNNYYCKTRRMPMMTMAISSSNNSHNNYDDDRRPTLRGVVFDMDGTLTIPNLDFAVMYDRCGVDRNDDILTAIAAMDEAKAARAKAIVEEMEEEGRRTLQLMPGTVPVLQWLAFYKIPMALVTRNTYASTVRLMELLLEGETIGGNPITSAAAALSFLPSPVFHPIVSRDYQPERIPPKPSPEAMNHIVQAWNLGEDIQQDASHPNRREIVMVGDSPSNDIQFGKNAGVSTALLWQQEPKGGGDVPSTNNDHNGADIVVPHLSHLPKELLARFHLVGTQKQKQQHSLLAPQPTSTAGIAAYQGDMKALRSLSLQEILSKEDDTHNTPLIWACEAGHETVVRHLLERISKEDQSLMQRYVNMRGYQGATAISRAARRGHVPIIQGLLLGERKGVVNTNIPNDKLQYPLHVAAFRQHHTIVETLLQAGADPHVVDHKGRTPYEDTKCPNIRTVLSSVLSPSL
jgi:phosphoglycolate phosphatase-like HAD superfamily hydrolase